jgi:hypothetical protein
MENPIRQRLDAVRQAVLKVHKALIDSERGTYEQTVGRIQSTNQFLQLVIQDPWFAWLQPISQLIVSMDEAVDSESPLTAAQVEAFIRETSRLLAPSDIGEGLSRHYHDAMQRDPNVVLAHGELIRVLGTRRPKIEDP